MKPTSQKNKRSGKSTGALVVESYWARMDGVADLVCSGGTRHSPRARMIEDGAPRDYKGGLCLASGRERDVLARFSGATGLGEHGALRGKATGRIQTLRGVEGLTVGDGRVTFSFKRTGGIDVSGKLASPGSVKRVAKYGAEIKRLQRLMA